MIILHLKCTFDFCHVLVLAVIITPFLGIRMRHLSIMRCPQKCIHTSLDFSQSFLKAWFNLFSKSPNIFLSLWEFSSSLKLLNPPFKLHFPKNMYIWFFYHNGMLYVAVYQPFMHCLHVLREGYALSSPSCFGPSAAGRSPSGCYFGPKRVSLHLKISSGYESSSRYFGRMWTRYTVKIFLTTSKLLIIVSSPS